VCYFGRQSKQAPEKKKKHAGRGKAFPGLYLSGDAMGEAEWGTFPEKWTAEWVREKTQRIQAEKARLGGALWYPFTSPFFHQLRCVKVTLKPYILEKWVVYFVLLHTKTSLKRVVLTFYFKGVSNILKNFMCTNNT
jgi:hypothetical protein